MKTYIGISRDHSGSMRSYANEAREDYNQLIETIKNNATKEEIDTIVSVVKCGVGYEAKNIMEITNSNVQKLKPLGYNQYIADGNWTPLFDSIVMLIDLFKSLPDADDPNVNFLIMAITDGEDNSSKNAYSFKNKIKELQATDRWTFVFRVPLNHKKRLTNNFNIPSGNVLEWETTNEGLKESSIKTVTAVSGFYKQTKLGTKSTRDFYSTDLSKVSVSQIKSKLIDISGKVEIWNVETKDHGRQIRDFCEEHLKNPMKRGSAFYLLMKPESEVQDYKQIVIRNKKTGEIYSGATARQILGLPYNGTVKVIPGNHGKYDIFIQSTSVNRKLVKGTQVLYWDEVGEEYQTSKPVYPAKTITKTTKEPVKTKTTKEPVKTAESDFVVGYKIGFADGKNKIDCNVTGISEYNFGYVAGYKDGRGKKKKLFK